jgi:hypothetical protein
VAFSLSPQSQARHRALKPIIQRGNTTSLALQLGILYFKLRERLGPKHTNDARRQHRCKPGGKLVRSSLQSGLHAREGGVETGTETCHRGDDGATMLAAMGPCSTALAPERSLTKGRTSLLMVRTALPRGAALAEAGSFPDSACRALSPLVH